MRVTNVVLPDAKTKTASGKNSRKPRGSELQQGGYRTGSSSFPPQVDAIIEPGRKDLPGCSSLTASCCAVEKGRIPVVPLVELEQVLLPEQVLAEQQQELRPVSHPFRIPYHNLCCHNQCRSNHHSIRLQHRIHMTSEPELLHDGPNGRSRQEHRSERQPHMGCSSIGYGESGHQFRLQLPGELVRLSR